MSNFQRQNRLVPSRFGAFWWTLLSLWTLAWAWQFNVNWHDRTSLNKILEMNDVASIMAGYRQTPSLWHDSWQWWHGSWIQEGIHVFRPLASYLLWSECWLGLHLGFESVAWLGFALLLALCGACVALAWRLTRSPLSTLLSATLAATTPYHIMGDTVPRYWLAWFPVHHDLLAILAIIGALFWLDVWLETGRKRHLAATWACFLVGALTKEYGYIFPLLAALWVWARAPQSARLIAWRQVAWWGGVTFALFAYRALVLTDPYNPPPLKRVHFIRKPWLYWFYPFYRYVPIGIFWLPGLALLLYGVGALWRHAWRDLSWKRWLDRPGMTALATTLTIAAVLAYIEISTGSVFQTLWKFFDPNMKGLVLSDLIPMTFLIYVLALIWKTRRQKQGVLALGLLIAIYLPVFTYLGWHYCLAGWFVRAGVWWPVVLHLIIQDWNLDRFFEPNCRTPQQKSELDIAGENARLN